MPGALQAWYGFQDLEMLADREAELTGEFEIAQLNRLAPLVHAHRDRVIRACMRCWRRSDGSLQLQLSYNAELSLLCQRCLEPVEVNVDETADWDIGCGGQSRATVPAEGDVLDLGDQRVRPLDLLEDELILSLPMVPRHPSIDECGALAQNLDHAAHAEAGESESRTLEV